MSNQAEKKETRTLAQKLLELQKTVVKLSKNERGYDYKFVSGSKLLSFIRPAMDELSLLLVPNTVNVEQQIVKTLDAIPPSGSFKGRPEKHEVLVTLTKTFTWIDAETGETLQTTFIAQGCNGWDKAIGSAETYAERYFLLKFFHIATDEDDVDLVNAIRSNADDADHEKSSQAATKSAPARKSSPKAGNAAKTPENTQSATAAPAGFTPMEPEKYDLFVAGYAQGKKMRSGADIRESYQKQTGAGPAEMKAFDDDVFRYQLANNIQPSNNA